MLLIDDLLFGGLRFIFDKIATVVDQEMNDEGRLHQTLMEAQMHLEAGDISEAEFADVERTVIGRLRDIREARTGGAPSLTDEGVRVSGVDITGPDIAGPDIAGPDIAGPEITDAEIADRDISDRGNTDRSNTDRGDTRRGNTGRSNAGSGSTGRSNTGRHRESR